MGIGQNQPPYVPAYDNPASSPRPPVPFASKDMAGKGDLVTAANPAPKRDTGVAETGGYPLPIETRVVPQYPERPFTTKTTDPKKVGYRTEILAVPAGGVERAVSGKAIRVVGFPLSVAGAGTFLAVFFDDNTTPIPIFYDTLTIGNGTIQQPTLVLSGFSFDKIRLQLLQMAPAAVGGDGPTFTDIGSKDRLAAFTVFEEPIGVL